MPNMFYNRQPQVIFHKLSEEAILPEYATPGSSGMDVRCLERVVLPPGSRAVVRTGLSVSFFDPRYELQVRPRSGLAAKHGITVLNTPGTIDSDYVGTTDEFEIRVILINHGDAQYEFNPGDKVAQLVLSEVVKLSTAFNSKSERVGGFGSTGS